MKGLSWAHLGAPPAFDPHRKFVSSPLLSPAALAAVRLLLALYALCAIATDLAFDVALGAGHSFLSYFTILSYIGLTAYYWAAAVQTLAYARYGRYPLQRWPKPLQALHVLLQSTVVTFPFIVTIVFWVLLADATTFATRYDAWSNISIHALNSALALFELLLTNAPPAPWPALPLQILFLCAYLAVAYITFHTQGFYPYPFLNPSPHPALLAGYILGIAAGACAVFLLARAIAVLRQRLAIRYSLLPSLDDAPPAEAIDEWEAVEVVRPGAGGAGAGNSKEGVRVVEGEAGAV
ncbi:hypothetical protein DFH07DRAFT_1061309 [Mycena maculata]|uniref:FAR-17a/AIG1-like protein n=1 Tax=Mycena maculata TaxID=230809 RepID=A0AAD7NBW2_9AGAR|nr:hypothetical protein DFH07DRAFT_1061309 [Mycena maculata]